MNAFLFLVLLVFFLPATVAADSAYPIDSAGQRPVAKLVAVLKNGMRETGSAVVLASHRLVTNCHVIAGAARIEVHFAGTVFTGEAVEGDSYRDLCFLHVEGIEAAPVDSIEVGATRVGLEVEAVGYSGGVFQTAQGRIIGLHTCECDGGKVIQTSASFDRGASGGGLFDRQGRLVGILTFKSRGGGDFHFAVPVGWLRHVATLPAGARPGAESFWSVSSKESGYFLAACSLGERKDWRALARLADEWREREPSNPEAWMASGRAHRGLGRVDEALSDFRRVLMLDSTHAEAQWALQELEFLGDKSIGGEGV